MKKNSVAGSISLVMVIMILSRVLSLVSTQVYLSHFGASGSQINIYSYAISVPNIIFNCFGTALSTVVIPIYAGHVANKRAKEAKYFADNIITISMSFTLLLVLAGVALSFVLPHFTAFKDNSSDLSYATKALMIMMPVMFFYALNYIFQGMLQSVGKYNWPAFVSVPSSLIVILYVLLLGDRFGVDGLLVATFIGLSLQAIILLPPLYNSGYRYRPCIDFKHSDIKTAGKMTVPVLVGISAYQLNMFYNVTMIANFKGMVTLLTYVQNITLYMVLAFVYSITAVIYPRLTAFAAKEEMGEYKKTLSDITKTIITLLLPITFGFIAVRFRLLELIAKWGQITEGEINAAAGLMCMYSIGILAVGIKEVYDRAFYAIKNTFIPALNGFIVMVLNILLSQIFMKFMGAFGIPLSYSVSSIIGAIVLFAALSKKTGKIADGLFLYLFKCILASVIMFFVVLWCDSALDAIFAGDGVTDRLLRLFIPCGVGVITYAVMGIILKIDYVVNILCSVLRRFKGEKTY